MSVVLPPQFPAFYKAANFTQRVDHTNTLDNRTFSERYLLNDTFWSGPGAPILFYTGAEGSGVPAIFSHSGYIVDTLARELSALVVFAEMRFFGTSMPFGEAGSMVHSRSHLGLLSIEQALADYVALIHGIKAARHAARSPVIAVGGSLAGSLAFWLRAKYPSVVSMSLASSAPILGYPGLTSPFGWYRVATQAFESQVPTCPDLVRRGFTALRIASAPAITRAFNTCQPVAESDRDRVVTYLVSSLTGRLASMAESAYPPKFSPIRTNCAAMAKEHGAATLAPVILAPGRCLNVRQTANGVGVERGVRGPSTAGDAWFYLACTEIIHPIAANNVTDMFPPQEWSVAGLESECRSKFGVEPRPSWMPLSMGLDQGLDGLARSTSHVIFTNGLMDPWSAQSVTRNASDTLVALNIPDGSHHSDLGAPSNPTASPDDSPSLRSVRKQQLELLKKWLREL